MTDAALELIQTKIAYLEQATAELSDAVFRQHRAIEALEAKLKGLGERLAAAQTEETARPPEQERPPHY